MASKIRVRCAICESWFTAKNRAARYCSDVCRQRAMTNRRRTSRQKPAEGALVAAVRTELDQAGKVGTVAGQLALTLARQIEASTTGSTTAARELERQMDRALDRVPGGATPPAPPAPDAADEPEDELDRARQGRDAKLSAAAG